jgi:hypothetical protein
MATILNWTRAFSGDRNAARCVADDVTRELAELRAEIEALKGGGAVEEEPKGKKRKGFLGGGGG